MQYSIVEPDPHSSSVPKGAASVGQLAELDESAQVFVLYMRRWTSSLDERKGVFNDATERYGVARAHLVIGALDIFLRTVANYAMRPIQKHGRNCSCLGEDEATLAEVIAGAGRQAGRLLRMLCGPLIAANGFTETIAAALQLHEVLQEPRGPVSPSQRTLH